MINYLNENDRPSHHHDRRPDRVLSLPQEVDGQSARGRRRCAELCRSDAPRLAARPGRDPGRRNARPGNDRSGHHRGRNGPHRVRHAAHHRVRQGTVNRIIDVFPDEPAGTDSHAAFDGDHRRACRRRCCPRSAAGASRRYEMLVVTPGIANLIRENKTFRITSAIQTGAQARHACCWTTTCSSLWKAGADHEGRRAWQSATCRTNWSGGLPTPERGVFDDEPDVERRARTRRKDGEVASRQARRKSTRIRH